MVRSPSDEEELWIPASLVPNSSASRSWSFRPRKLDHGSGLADRARGGASRTGPREGRETGGPPAIVRVPSSIRATAGRVARLSVEVRHADDASVFWSRDGEDRNIELTGRYRERNTTGAVSLEILACRASDSGTYHCRVQRPMGRFCSAKIPLYVVGDDQTNWIDRPSSSLVAPRLDPANREIPARGILFSEKEEAVEKKSKEEDREEEGLSGRQSQVEAHCPGIGRSAVFDEEVGSLGWEAEQFTGRYLELEKLGSGRFATVRRAKDRGTGQEVALKQTCRRRQSRSLTRAEYDFLTSTRHSNIVRAFALFENAPRPGVDTIVLELVRGSSTLLAYLSEKNEYTEATVAKYAEQLLSALGWLHSRDKAHLDLKPENVLIDRETGLAKLIDLGEAVRAAPLDEVVPPADLEFAAPESVLGRPTGSYTDMWAAGVFIYVLLSGLSPFLDDSIEETTANILKCDFCFPEEYFESISSDAKDLLGRLLCLRGEERASAKLSLVSPWFEVSIGTVIPSSRMAAFIERRAHRSKTRQDRNGSFYS